MASTVTVSPVARPAGKSTGLVNTKVAVGNSLAITARRIGNSRRAPFDDRPHVDGDIGAGQPAPVDRDRAAHPAG